MINHKELNLDNPKSLFKFSKITDYTYSGLINKAIFLSKAINLNDPFELDIDFDTSLSDEEKQILKLAPSFDEQSIKETLEKAKCKLNKMLDRTLIFSLTSNPYELLMWSHYADEHKGICIEYERQECELLSNKKYCQKVIYPKTEQKTKIKLLQLATPSSINKELIDDLIYARKSSTWEYENEWRLVIEDYSNIHVQLLNNSVRIKSITFGLNTPSHHKAAIFELINKLYDEEIVFYQIIKSSSLIAIEFTKFDPCKHISNFMAPKFEID